VREKSRVSALWANFSKKRCATLCGRGWMREGRSDTPARGFKGGQDRNESETLRSDEDAEKHDRGARQGRVRGSLRREELQEVAREA